MDFRAEERQARANTARLVFYFLLAILGTIGMLYLYYLLFWLIFFAPNDGIMSILTVEMLWHPRELAWISGVALGLIALGSVWKSFTLRAGGQAVARMLRCRAIDPATANLAERRLLNIVSEMATASGMPVPRTWLLDDVGGINAFAAGYTPRDAAIGVTRGSLEYLTRDELQGVIAHEFSHIKNADIRINMRLIGWLHGILMIGYLGGLLLNIGSLQFIELKNEADDAGMIQLAYGHYITILFVLTMTVTGTILLGVGCMGFAMAQRIRNAISRERELLADAAAVEFTRNRAGLAGALKKIGSQAQGVLGRPSPRNRLLNHLFFNDVTATPNNGADASHPDLRHRIWRLDPDWDGVFHLFRGLQTGADLLQMESPIAMMGGEENPATGPESPPLPLSEMEMWAAAIPANLPPQVLRMSERKDGPRQVFYTLLLDDDLEVRKRQMAEIARQEPRLIRPVTEGLMLFCWLDYAQRMALIDHLLPAVGKMKPRDARTLQAGLAALVAAGGHTTLTQVYLLRRLELMLAENGTAAKKKKKKQAPEQPSVVISREALSGAFGAVLSTLAHADSAKPEAARQTFETMRERLDLPAEAVTFLPREQCKLSTLDRATTTLRALPKDEKNDLIDVCRFCLAADHRITLKESQLLRLVAATMGAAMPGFLPNVNE